VRLCFLFFFDGIVKVMGYIIAASFFSLCVPMDWWCWGHAAFR